jgi:Fe-S oxidoreductase
MSKSLLKDVVPIDHVYIKDNVLDKGSITGVAGEKSAWAANLHVARDGEYTFFAGCGYQFMKYAAGMMETARKMGKLGLGMDKMIGISRAFRKVGVDLAGMTAKIAAAATEDPYTRVLLSAVRVLQKLGLDIGYMYEDEPCCGSPMYYSGFVDEYAENAQKNFSLFKDRGIKKLIGIVPACTASLRDGYPKYVKGYDLQVWHLSQIVAQRLREKNLKPRLKEKLVITYHEPCQLSRYLNIIDQPREILNRIEGLELRLPDEDRCGRWSTCCGGGGLEAFQPALAERVGVRRVKELLETGARVMVTNCPACMMQLIKVARILKAEVKVLDLFEILDEALP